MGNLIAKKRAAKSPFWWVVAVGGGVLRHYLTDEISSGHVWSSPFQRLAMPFVKRKKAKTQAKKWARRIGGADAVVIRIKARQ